MPRRAAKLRDELRYPYLETAHLDLMSQDALLSRLSASVFGLDWQMKDLFDFEVDSGLANAGACAELIRATVSARPGRAQLANEKGADKRWPHPTWPQMAKHSGSKDKRRPP
jgi:hypothetical protein